MLVGIAPDVHVIIDVSELHLRLRLWLWLPLRLLSGELVEIHSRQRVHVWEQADDDWRATASHRGSRW